MSNVRKRVAALVLVAATGCGGGSPEADYAEALLPRLRELASAIDGARDATLRHAQARAAFLSAEAMAEVVAELEERHEHLHQVATDLRPFLRALDPPDSMKLLHEQAVELAERAPEITLADDRRRQRAVEFVERTLPGIIRELEGSTEAR